MSRNVLISIAQLVMTSGQVNKLEKISENLIYVIDYFSESNN